MRSFRRSLPAVTGLLFAGALVAAGVSPASAAAPYTGSQATALVSGTPQVQANCPGASPPPAQSGGPSTLGPVSVSGPAGAQCNLLGASSNGAYQIAGVTGAATNLRFSASCINVSGGTNGLVDVPAGTTVPGMGVVGVPTTVTANVTVTYPGGTTAVLNSVATTATSVTYTAIQITGGVGSGTIVGRAVCGFPVPYPLAVSAPGAGVSAPDLALTPVSDGGGSSANRVLFVGGAISLLILAQVVMGRTMWRRRRGVTGS